jgi:ribosomal protein S8
MTDPIADFLARIRNAILARRSDLVCPSSSLKLRLAEVMRDEGYITSFEERDNFDGHKELIVRLRWPEPGANAITGAAVPVPASGSMSAVTRLARCALASVSRSFPRRAA